MTAVAPLRYFELVDEATERAVFWEVSLDGPCLVTCAGPVGTAGKLERELCASEVAARAELAQRIVERVGQGYRECADRRLDARTLALEDAIAADPEDPLPYLVYADWIQTLGDPRGALIVAQHAGDASMYLAKHAAVFLGPLAEHVGYDGSLLELRWFCGFIAQARLRSHDGWRHRTDLVLQQLLDHASARWLRELTIDIVDDDMTRLEEVMRILAARPREQIRVLDIGELGRLFEIDDPDRWPPQAAADARRLWRGVPRLRRLVMRGEPLHLGELALPELAHVELRCRRIVRAVAQELADGDLPALRRLAIYTRAPVAEAVQTIARGHELAQIVVRGALDGDALCRVRYPAALRELELSHCNITDQGVEALAGSGLALDILDVTRNVITPGDVARLERIAKLVIV